MTINLACGHGLNDSNMDCQVVELQGINSNRVEYIIAETLLVTLGELPVVNSGTRPGSFPVLSVPASGLTLRCTRLKIVPRIFREFAL